MIASVVILTLKAMSNSQIFKSPTSVAYLFCNHQDQEHQTLLNLYACLLKQLYRDAKSVPRTLFEIWDKSRNFNNLMEEDARSHLRNFFSAHLSSTRLFIVIDALDELNDGSVIKTLISELKTFQREADNNSARFNLMITSRPIPQIEDLFSNDYQVKIITNDQDIRVYVKGHIQDLAPCVQRNSELQEEIKKKVIERASGMYVTIMCVYPAGLTRV